MQDQSPTPLAPIRWADVQPHLEAEIAAARELLTMVEQVSELVAVGSDPAAIHEGIAAQENALSQARKAVDRRRRLIGELTGLPARMKQAPGPEQKALHACLNTGQEIRERIENAVQRTSFVARKSAAWCEGHRAFLIEEVLRRQESGLYRAPGAPDQKSPAVSASLDRSV